MPKQLEVIACDDCPVKLKGHDGFYCNYGTFDQDAETAPADCKVRDGGVLVTIKVRR